MSSIIGTAVRGDRNSTEESQRRLDTLLDRIQQLTATSGGITASAENYLAHPVTADPAIDTSASHGDVDAHGDWFPAEPDTFRAGGLTESEVENLVLKVLNGRSEASGRDVSEQVKVPFRLVDPLLQKLKQDQFVTHRGAAMMNDYVYQLSGLGRERAKKLAEHCTYMGAAPVTLSSYVESVSRQTLANQHPTEEDLHRAFSDLLIDKRMLLRLGPAINSGRGLFLYGAPGNGKTSIAERVTRAFGEYIWIPRAIGIDGEIMRGLRPKHARGGARSGIRGAARQPPH